MAELRLEGVSKLFGATTAVGDMTLSVDDGEFFILLGPTGAGKTTTLRLVAGLERPDVGTVSIGGRDMTDAPPHARDVAFVFQEFSLYPHYTVFDNLAFPLRSPLRKWPQDRIRAKVMAVAEMLGIEDKLDNRATELSGGEMQRVAIGRALVRSSSAYLMDEPLSSLDAKLRNDLRVELKRIQVELGTTLLYVTHDQVEALTMADRIGVLREGHLVQVGTPKEIYERPHNVYVAQRLGSPQINLLPAGVLGLAAGPAGTASVGLRPEEIEIGQGDVRAKVIAVEHLGAETVVLLGAAGQEFHAYAPRGRHLRLGDEIPTAFNDNAAMFFDRDGTRIGNGA